MVEQIFLSLQMKRSMIISNKHRMYELVHEFPRKLRLRILGIQEKSGNLKIS